ncbi:hypothetical protein PPERSA_11976 [Pseudocohnilembus persalinus]|uniref:Carboxypeptidase n=1 Tax=Pseudocohnilembus persalinus TaxID=266149 RepID=A0A0V0QKH6_PSEPJ|nr:hypothetical protein PPERSA_11976 [Pseudocohnilembus persalinus]|eukprot:KRX02636.1 hypothetical protein PPERSA_11976 [Pseudocohnilembus persalinus]
MKTFLISLALICIVFSAQTAEDDLVEEFPGYGKVDYDIYSGMLDVSGDGKRQLHYVLLESAGNPSKDPLVIWLNGGPGCSSLLGLVGENGPYLFRGIDYFMSDFQKYSWNNKANVLYLEGPPGVGFSINNDPDYVYNDINTANDFMQALVVFRERFENILDFSNPLWLSGESYAGMYVPYFTKAILDHNEKNGQNSFAIKGFLVGNNCMLMQDDEILVNLGMLVQYVDNQFFSNELRGYFYNDCFQDVESENCETFFNTFANVQNNTNPYNIYNYTYSYGHDESKQQKMLLNKLGNNSPLMKKVKEVIFQANQFKNSESDIPTPDQIQEAYFNLEEVKKALHVDTEIEWAQCNDDINEDYEVSDNSSHLYQYFVEAGLDILTYSGNSDSIVSWQYTYYCLDDVATNKEYGIDITPATNFQQWLVPETQQVGGMVQYFTTSSGSNFVYAMVRDAGHEVPEYQPEAAYQMFNNFINGEKI